MSAWGSSGRDGLAAVWQDRAASRSSLGPDVLGGLGEPAQILTVGVLEPGNISNYLYVASTRGVIFGFRVRGDGVLTPAPGSPLATVAEGQPEGLYCNVNPIYVALSHAGAAGAYHIDDTSGSLTPVQGSPFEQVWENSIVMGS